MKEAIMAAESAIKSAATVYQGTSDGEGAAALAFRFYQGITNLSGIDPAQAEQIEQASNMANAQANLAGAGVQATVARDLSTDEARWQDALVNNPGEWYNNVGHTKASSGGGNGPDFRFKDDNADVTPLWLNGKYGPAPAWVFEKLSLPFPGSQSIVSAAPEAQPQVATPQPQVAHSTPIPF